MPAHEAMSTRFVHLIFVGCCHIANVLVGWR